MLRWNLVNALMELSLLRGHTQKKIASLSCSQRLRAFKPSVALLDRGWGKPKQTVGGDLENPLAVRVTAIEHAIVHPRKENGS